MAEKVTVMVLKVDLQCPCCYKRVRKILCKFPEIRDQKYDTKGNKVTITVVCCNPEKIRDKLCCKGAKVIKSIEIKEPAKPKEPEKPKEPKKPKEPEKPKEVVAPPEKPKEAPKPEPTLNPPKTPDPIPVFPMQATCCRPCSQGYGGGPCHYEYCPPEKPKKASKPEPTPNPPKMPDLVPVFPMQLTCCVPCSQGYGGGPCHYGYGPPKKPKKAPEPQPTPNPPKTPNPVPIPQPSCGPCSQGYGGGPCHYWYGPPEKPKKAPKPEPTPNPPKTPDPVPIFPMQPTCCGPCSQGYGGGPCHYGYGVPPPPQPCYDGHYENGCHENGRGTNYHFTEESLQSCSIM